MASNFPEIAVPYVDPVVSEINQLSQRLHSCIEQRQIALISRYQKAQNDKTARLTTRVRKIDELSKLKENTEQDLQLNELSELQNRFLAEIEVELEKANEPLPETRIVFKRDNLPLEQLIAELGEVLEEEVPHVPNRQTMRPVLTVGKRGTAPGEYFRKEDEVDLEFQATVPVDTKLEHILPAKLNLPVQTAQNCLARTFIHKRPGSSTTNTEISERILQELSYYQSHPHPDFEVFPCQTNVDFWRIIMSGPDRTPYCQATFELFIEFKDDYPAKPPNIGFITPIYHCNINSAGKICHTILDRFYASGVRIREIFNHVHRLLIVAELDDPLVDSVKATELRCNRPLYLQKAWNHAQVHARVRTKRDIRIDLLGCDQDVQVSYPKHLVCPLTLALFVDPVITPEGETYEKAAILEHLKSGKNYDPYSYKELKEEDLRGNKAVLSFVKAYKDEI